MSNEKIELKQNVIGFNVSLMEANAANELVNKITQHVSLKDLLDNVPLKKLDTRYKLMLSGVLDSATFMRVVGDIGLATRNTDLLRMALIHHRISTNGLSDVITSVMTVKLPFLGSTMNLRDIVFIPEIISEDQEVMPPKMVNTIAGHIMRTAYARMKKVWELPNAVTAAFTMSEAPMQRVFSEYLCCFYKPDTETLQIRLKIPTALSTTQPYMAPPAGLETFDSMHEYMIQSLTNSDLVPNSWERGHVESYLAGKFPKIKGTDLLVGTKNLKDSDEAALADFVRFMVQKASNAKSTPT